jgi:hypothetical protein
MAIKHKLEQLVPRHLLLRAPHSYRGHTNLPAETLILIETVQLLQPCKLVITHGTPP